MTKRNPAADLDDAETFDVDAWIDGYMRPEMDVELYPNDAAYQARVAAIEAQIPAAERNADRGLDDPTAEALWAQIAEMQAERSRTALKVRVRQPLDTELAAAYVAAEEAGVTALEDRVMWGLAAACVEPPFTGPQLVRLRNRDRTGEAMTAQLTAAVNRLIAGGPAVPSSPEH